MPVKAPCSARLGLVFLAGVSAAALVGCSSLNGASTRIASLVNPYRVDVVQGNFVSREQVEALQPGMSRQQVREILGTPLVTSLFHADRWEYVFTFKRPGEEPQTRKLTVFFKGMRSSVRKATRCRPKPNSSPASVRADPRARFPCWKPRPSSWPGFRRPSARRNPSLQRRRSQPQSAIPRWKRPCARARSCAAATGVPAAPCCQRQFTGFT